MRAIWQDVRLAGRSLARRAGWTTAGVVTLAIGIAGSTLVISLLDQALLRPLRFRDGDRLVTLYVTSGAEYSPMPYPDYTEFRAALDETLDLAAFCRVFMTVRGGGAPENHQGEMVSGSFFSVLGIQPALGRFIGPPDDVVPGGPQVVVLSDFLWRRQFTSDPDIVGRQVRLDDRTYEVIGVAPPGFRGAVWPSFQTAFWIPAMMADQYSGGRDALNGRALAVFQTVGRLTPGTRLEAVQARIDPLDDVLSRDRDTNPYYGDTGAPWRVQQRDSEVEEGHLLADHVHMMLAILPKRSVSQVIGFIKGKSAIHIAREYAGRPQNFVGQHFWARGYFVSTVGRDEQTIRTYIRAQEQEDCRQDQLRFDER